MYVIMLDTIKGEDFSFTNGEKYKALDGDEIGIKELEGKILIRQPNSPKKINWYCEVDKSCIEKLLIVI